MNKRFTFIFFSISRLHEACKRMKSAVIGDQMQARAKYVPR
jgi:hypothetical protein